jgi:hypothetical protein
VAYALWNSFICKLQCVLDMSETEGVNVLFNYVISIIYNNNNNNNNNNSNKVKVKLSLCLTN